jgi:hypothetical protein
MPLGGELRWWPRHPAEGSSVTSSSLGERESSVLTGLFQLRVEPVTNLSRKLVVCVAQPLLMVAVVEDDVVRGVDGLVLVDRRARLVQQRRHGRLIDLSAKPAAFENDAPG